MNTVTQNANSTLVINPINTRNSKVTRCALAAALIVACSHLGAMDITAAENLAIAPQVRGDSTGALADASTKNEVTPLLVLSEKLGDVGKEAVGMGLPVLKQKSLAAQSIDMMLYVDVDTLNPSDYRATFDLIHDRIRRGSPVIIETSNFDFDKMHRIVASEFPMVNKADIQDVAVLLQQIKGQITVKRVDPSEMAMHAGVQHKDTTDAKYAAAAANGTKSRAKATAPASLWLLRFARKAYEADPSDAYADLAYNGAYVDVWKRKTVANSCVVSWRGTNNFYDFYLDSSAQLYRTAAITIPGYTAKTFKAGNGFVSRVHAYDSYVSLAVTANKCTSIFITGHSLGGAAAQINGVQFSYQIPRGKLPTVVAFNAPLSFDAATRDYIWGQMEAARFYEWKTYCRGYDMIVNSVPSGLHRMGPPESQPIKGCDYYGKPVTTSIFNSTARWMNHPPELWETEWN